MYGKVMSIPDNLIIDYYELLTDITDAEISEFKQMLTGPSANPMDLKKRLAREIVEQFHGTELAGEAESHFEKVVQRKEAPKDIPEYILLNQPVNIIDLLVKQAWRRVAAKQTQPGKRLCQA